MLLSVPMHALLLLVRNGARDECSHVPRCADCRKLPDAWLVAVAAVGCARLRVWLATTEDVVCVPNHRQGELCIASTKGSSQRRLQLQAMEEAVKSGDDHASDPPESDQNSKAVHL